MSLPHDIFLKSGVDAWISLLLSGLFIQLNIFIIWALNRRYPNLHLYEFSTVIVG
jgi:hypothetical protein